MNTANIKVLTNEEMTVLFKSYQNGNLEAKQELINGNLKLVLSILKKYNNRTSNMDDLFQVGCIGLIKAIDNFDISVGVQFSTYAVPMIIGEVRRYLRDYNSIRVSRSVKDIAYKALSVKEKYLHKYNKEASIDEIAKELNLTTKEVSNALEAIQDPVSLYEPVFNDGSDTLFVMDQVSDNKNNDENWTEDIALKEAIAKLNDREKNIVMLRFFKGKTQMEVANEIGISQAQVSRLEKNAINHMKKNI